MHSLFGSFVNTFYSNISISEIYAIKWFFSFYSIDFPVDYVMTIIDIFLLEGYPALIKVALAILKLLEDKLLRLSSIDDISELLKNPINNFCCTRDNFFNVLNSFEITS